MSTSMPIRGRGLEAILSLHDLPVELFEESTVYDLGCGKSDLGADLALRGIKAQVTGFDSHRAALDLGQAREGSAKRQYARLDALPVEDETADIVLATYSSPYWAGSSRQISAFFSEASRVTRINGIESMEYCLYTP